MLVTLAAMCLARTAGAMDFGGIPGMGGGTCRSYGCTKGKVPVPQWPVRYTSTGCSGIGGGMVMSMGGGEDDGPIVERCCDLRHACYQVCGTSKAACDKQFKKCTDDACEKQPLLPATYPGGEEKNCSSTVSLKVMMAQLGGCKDFDAGQAKGCSCVKPESEEKERKRTLSKFRTKFAGKAGNVEKLMEKYGDSKKSFAILMMRLVDKYHPKSVKKVKDPKAAQMEEMMKGYERDNAKTEAVKKRKEAKEAAEAAAAEEEEVVLDEEDDKDL